MRNVTSIIILLFFVVGGILLQIFLSKKQNKWLGLILPVICLIISILAVLNIASFTYNSTQMFQTIGDNGKVTNQTISTTNNTDVDLTFTIFTSIVVFLICNIPTAIMLAIYAGCREKKPKNLELEKMSIQDLD